MTTVAARTHRTTVVNELRDLEPTADGWKQHETTGRACTVCTCGLNTGFIARQEALGTYREHNEKPKTL